MSQGSPGSALHGIRGRISLGSSRSARPLTSFINTHQSGNLGKLLYTDEERRKRSTVEKHSRGRITKLDILSTYEVTTTSDAGAGSLRTAITLANSNPGLDMITFNIPGPGIHTISPTSPLPQITGPVIIDGTTQPGFAGVPLIELSGNLAGAGVNGLVLLGGNSTVRGMIINRWVSGSGVNGNGIVLDVNGGNIIEGCYIGTNAAGTARAANNGYGIGIYGGSGGNLIGGTTPEARNVISGNLAAVGSDAPGVGRNVICGNYIGLNATGDSSLGNYAGVFIATPDDTIGGLIPAARNVVSGSTVHGVWIASTGTRTQVWANYIGTDATGLVEFGNAGDGVYIADASDCRIGHLVTGARNVISGNTGWGLHIEGAGATRDTVFGNYIGTNATGDSALPNLLGIGLDNTSGNIIGGTISEARNIISGNLVHGIQIGSGCSDNHICGNYIGLNAAGSDTIGNGDVGVAIFSANNWIDGLATTAPNVISGNGSYGIYIGAGADFNTVWGNYIGTDATGQQRLGNRQNGIVISNASNNTIGGVRGTAFSNVISGNVFYGIQIQNTASTHNEVVGNYIGTNVDGTSIVSNAVGVVIYDAPENFVGSRYELGGEGNIVAGNTLVGIAITQPGATQNKIFDNYIGTNDAYAQNIGNTGDAVQITSSQDTVKLNVIAHNIGAGIFIASGKQNLTRENRIYSNTGLGIDLASRGLTKNDSLDADSGANNLQNFPILDSATVAGSQVKVHGHLSSKANAQYRIDFFQNAEFDDSHFGEGKIILTQPGIVVMTDSVGNAPFDTTLPYYAGQGDYLTATATDDSGNTSEFSQALCLVDTDGDGLLDSWEIPGWGIDINSDGVIEQDLHALGAKLNHKDLFVEVDAMAGYAPPIAALEGVRASFGRVPNVYVNNPDGQPGINFHYILDDTTIPVMNFPNTWTEFDAVKSAFFGTPTERGDTNWTNIRKAKNLVYRYCIFARTFGMGNDTLYSGISELANGMGGNDFMVTFGSIGSSGWNATKRLDDNAGTFMHELGHSLGLGHGGNQFFQNYKPNYYSVMNYTWQTRMTWQAPHSWNLDYSPVAIPTLNESNLNETVGLNPPVGVYRIVPMPFTDSLGNIGYALLKPGAEADWSGDGNLSTSVNIDINLVGDTISTPGETLTGYADWPNLKYNFRNSPDFQPGIRTTPLIEMPELTKDIQDKLNNLPPPLPYGVFIMDGQVDTSASLISSNEGINLYAKYQTGQLYVATQTAQAEGGDIFIFVTDSLRPLRNAPSGKNGQVAAWSAFLRNTLAGDSVQWFTDMEEPLTSIAVDSLGTVVEGVIDAELLWGTDSSEIYIAVGMYDPSGNGALLVQVPAGNGDGNIDQTEFYQLLGAMPPPSTYFVQQGNKLVGTGDSPPTNQGSAVALSADGNTAISGGPSDSNQVGAAWVFTRSLNAWSQQGEKLVGTDVQGSAALQGISVALSADGNTAIIGGYADNGNEGAAWIFTRTSGMWSQQGDKLVATDAEPGAEQGRSVALSADGNTAVVGGPNDAPNFPDITGAAWIYTRTDGIWSQQGNKLVGSGALFSSYQGNSVAISADGNTVLVGGPGDNVNTGAAWVFTRAGGVWTQQGSKLVGTGATGWFGFGSHQGYSVALSADGNTAIMGGPMDEPAGAVWVFTRSGGVWNQQGNKLIGSGAVEPYADLNQGFSVAISGDGNIALLGDPRDSNDVGAAWVFSRTGDVWSQQGDKFLASDAEYYQGFSVALSADGATAMVGGSSGGNQGAAWVFVHQDPLPITLTSFLAQPEPHGQGILLNWTTISEINNYGFEIQRSLNDETNYVTLTNSFIPGHGTTNVPQYYSYIDSTATAAHWYYRLEQIDYDGTAHYSAGISIMLTGVDQKGMPDRFALSQNYPDPFNPITTIQYQLPVASHAAIRIYNILGQEVATLVDGLQEAGYKSVVWNAQNVASGVYFYRMIATAGGSTFTDVRKMVVVK